MECFQQFCLTERLEQTVGGTSLDELRPDSIVAMGGDEDDRDLRLPLGELPLKFRPRHPRHGDIEDQTVRSVDAIRRQEIFSRREGADREAELLQQIW